MLDNVSEQLELVECLRAMYPLPEELKWTEDTVRLLEGLESGRPITAFDHDAISGVVRLQTDDDASTSIEVSISVSLKSSDVSLVPRQAVWMTRADPDRLLADVPPRGKDEGMVEYTLTVLDWIKTNGSNYRLNDTVPAAIDPKEGPEDVPGPLQRVWFWFPSLSSKDKRRDLVDYAQEYALNGFVLAGKPGLLCVEGRGVQVDRYMAAIKSHSWSDIPSYQKKVTERLRTPLKVHDRRFSDMQDITHLVPQYGQYKHRGDMGEVRRLMDEWGVGEDFGSVVMHLGT